jgi:hypothetical protein
MKMNCPKCESDDVYLCSAAYEQGSTRTTTTSRGTASTLGYSQGTGVGTAQTNISTTSSSVSRTAFAEKAAPPKSYLGKMILWAVGSLLAVLVLTPSVWSGLKHWAWISLAGSIVGTFFSFKNRPAYREALARWQKSWICTRCGNKFMPEDKTTATAEKV